MNLDVGTRFDMDSEDHHGDFTTIAAASTSPSNNIVNNIQSHDRATRPAYRDFLDVGRIDTDEWTVPISLPWFELKGLLEYQGLLAQGCLHSTSDRTF